MKAKVEQKVFTPVQLNLTFETQEEYDVFTTMLRWNKTIPRTIYCDELMSDSTCHKRVLLMDVMQSIVNVL